MRPREASVCISRKRARPASTNESLCAKLTQTRVLDAGIKFDPVSNLLESLIAGILVLPQLLLGNLLSLLRQWTVVLVRRTDPLDSVHDHRETCSLLSVGKSHVAHAAR